MNNWTIKRRIATAFLIMLLLVLILSGLSISLLLKIESNFNEVNNQAMPGIMISSQLQHLREESVLAALLTVVAETPEQKEAEAATAAQVKTQTSEVLERFKTAQVRPEIRADLDKVIAARQDYQKVRDKMLDLSKDNKQAEALQVYWNEVSPVFIDSENKIAEIFDHSSTYGKQLGENTSALITVSLVTASLVGIAALLIGIVLAIVITRSLNNSLQSIAHSLEAETGQIASASSHLAAASQTLAGGATTHSSALQETSASVEEIGSMTKRNAENAQKAQVLSGETRTAAETGSEQTGEMQASMEAIKEASREMAEAIAGIKRSSHDVSKIIKTIDEIAFQTNILALNAAVEAARAGEAGLGFAVVADEVRTLARRSATAAKETATMIEASVNQGNRGVEVNEKVNGRIAEIAEKSKAVGDSLSHIVAKAREVDALVATIAEASKEQSEGLDQIASAVAEMDKVTQQNSSESDTIATAAEELDSEIKQLRIEIGNLTRLVSA